LHFFVAPAALEPGVQTHLLPAGHRLVPNMQPALSTGETLLFTVKGSTDPAKGVASAFHIRSPALSTDAITLTKRTRLILVMDASLVRAGKHNTKADDRSRGLAAKCAEVSAS
jgi:hypothetical protein